MNAVPGIPPAAFVTARGVSKKGETPDGESLVYRAFVILFTKLYKEGGLNDGRGTFCP